MDMNYGPLEFGAYLRRQESREDDSAEVRGAREAAPQTGPERNRLAVVSGPGGLTPLQNARGDAVSVYEAILDRAPERGDPVRVRVQPAWRPVVLVLSSHQSVHWQIEAAAGADLRGILLAGSGESSVSGAASIPVCTIGGFYAFKRGSLEFRHLEREVLRCTGCEIEHFFGTYAEDHFEVGLD
jgi:hypothetical protein